MDRDAVIADLRKHFADRTDLAAVYLFGSVATGQIHAGSDVDVGLLYRTSPPATLLGQPYGEDIELSSRLGLHVQLVVMNTAPPDLVHRVLRDGILLAEQDRSLRIAFEVRARNAYFDLLPTLREYRHRAAT